MLSRGPSLQAAYIPPDRPWPTLFTTPSRAKGWPQFLQQTWALPQGPFTSPLPSAPWPGLVCFPALAHTARSAEHPQCPAPQTTQLHSHTLTSQKPCSVLLQPLT